MPDRPAVIAALVLERPLCVSCIARRADEPSAAALEASLEQLRHVLQIFRAQDRCRACGFVTTVYSANGKAR